MNHSHSNVIHSQTWGEHPPHQSGGLITAVKEMQSSFLELASAHSEYASVKMDKAVDKMTQAASVGFLLGPLLTVTLGLSVSAIVLYFGFDQTLFNNPDALTVIGLLIFVFAAAFVAALVYIKSAAKKAKEELACIQKELKRDLRLIGVKDES